MISVVKKSDCRSLPGKLWLAVQGNSLLSHGLLYVKVVEYHGIMKYEIPTDKSRCKDW